MTDEDELVARPVAVGLERGNMVAERGFEIRFGPEHQTADARMQAVGADDEIDLSKPPLCRPVRST
jgi:hypothetical protein